MSSAHFEIPIKVFSHSLVKMSSSTRPTSVSPVAIFSLVAVALYCAGFVRVELKFHDQDKRIEALEAILALNGYSQQFASSQDKEGELL